jgi:ATP-dependent Lon protease
MIPQTEESPKLREKLKINPASAAKDDLFGFGTAAKISGVEGRGTGEFALLVEGMARVRIDRITQERPFFQAEVRYHYDEGGQNDILQWELYANIDQLYRLKIQHYRRSSPSSSNYPASSCLYYDSHHYFPEVPAYLQY